MTFPVYETHPELADALRAHSRSWELPVSMLDELRFHGLVTPSGELTGIAKLILGEDGVALTSMEHPPHFFDEGGPAKQIVKMKPYKDEPNA